MSFDIGDRIEIVQTLGGKEHGVPCFKRGGNINQVPIGSRGKLVSYDGSDYLVAIDDYKEWYLNPNEVCRIGRGLKLRNPEEHPLFTIADNELLIFDGIVYRIDDERVNDEGDYLQKKSFLSWKKKRITPITDVRSLDDLFIGRNYHVFSEWQEESIKTLVKPKRKHITQMLYDEVFCHLRETDRKTRFRELLGVEEPQQQKDKATPNHGAGVRKQTPEERETQIKGVIGLLYDELQQLAVPPNSKDKIKFLRAEPVFPPLITSNLLVSGEEFFNLREAHNGAYHIQINGERKRFSTTLKNRIRGDFESDLEKFLYHQGLFSIVEDKERIKSLVSPAESLSKLPKMKEYEEQNFGFTQIDSQCYVWMRVPEVAIESPYDGNFYYFKSCKVGFRVWFEGNGLRYNDRLVMIDNNNHPFLHNARGNFQRVCVGDYRLPTDGRNIGHVIAKRLLLAEDLLLHGYTSNNYQDRYRLHENNDEYKRHIKKKKWLEKRNIMIAYQH